MDHFCTRGEFIFPVVGGILSSVRLLFADT